MWSRVVLVGLLLLAALAVPVSATPADLDVVGGLPLRAAGTMTVEAAAPTLVVRATDGALTATLAADRLELVAVEYWEEHRDGLGGGGARGVRTDATAWHDATLAVAARLDGFTFLAWGDDNARTDVTGSAPADAEDPAWQVAPDLRVFRLSAPLAITAPVPDDAVADPLRDQVFGRPIPFSHEVAAGALQVQAAAARHVLDGAQGGYLAGGRVAVAHAGGSDVFTAAERIEVRPGSIFVPGEGWTGPGTHEERIVRYLQWSTESGTLTVDTRDLPAALFAQQADLSLAGHLSIPDAVGAVTFSGADTRAMEADRLLVSGTVAARVLPADETGRARVQGSGDVTYVRIGADAESFPVAGVAAAAAGLAVLAAAAVALWYHGGLLVPLFSRVAKGDVLDHDKRAELYEAVKKDPGVSPQELVSRVGVGWSTVMYHLNVLERNELVVAIRDGRYRRYFDRTSGRYANGRKQMVAALKNPTTAAVADYVRAHPGAVQRRLAERFGLAASSVHWHVRRLEEAGLVVKERRAQVVALLPGPGWARMAASDEACAAAASSS